jgi:phosphate transport system permease protein
MIASRRFTDMALRIACTASVLIPLAALVFIVTRIGIDGIHRLSFGFLFGSLSHRPERTGIFPAVLGSIWMVSLTVLLAAPFSIAAAIYLEELASPQSRHTRWMKLAVSNLAGIPSIVYGLVGLAAFVRFLQLGQSILAGALTLGLLVFPTIVVVTQQALRTVPDSYREASLALGANPYQSVRFQILPAASRGIWTGLLLAISRAAGETAPLILVGAAYFVTRSPETPLDSYTVIPMQIFSWSSDAGRAFHSDAAAATLVLICLSLGLNGIVYRLRNRGTTIR